MIKPHHGMLDKIFQVVIVQPKFFPQQYGIIELEDVVGIEVWRSVHIHVHTVEGVFAIPTITCWHPVGFTVFHVEV